MGDNRSWIFQGRPDQYDLRSALKSLTELSWLVQRYRDRIHVGDRVYMWESGSDAGILAEAHVLTEPAELLEREDEQAFWVQPDEFIGPRMRVRLAIDRVLDHPLSRSAIKENPELADLLILRFASGTNFPVTDKQDTALRQMIDAMGSTESGTHGTEWAPWEVGIVVPAYFSMLHDDLDGKEFVKKHRYLQVSERLAGGRNFKSVERKFQNISAVLYLEDLAHIQGLKPMWNFQDELQEAVLEWLDGPAGEREQLRDVPRPWEAPQPTPEASADLEVPPPAVSPRSDSADRRREIARSYDAARLDATKRRLGRLGEEWAVEYERDRLKMADRPDLAAQVVRVAGKNDALGWDVESFAEDGERRLLEVKTTGMGIKTPFILTSNERKRWEDHLGEYEVFRIFDFGSNPHFYRLTGMPEDEAQLTAASWEVRPKGSDN